MREVTKEEFDRFIEDYPNKLVFDVYHVPEPPIASYNDFTRGKVWPQSVVAKIILNTAMKEHPLYKGEADQYYITEP